MSLRYRLFLWVSGLFLVAALSSLIMESFVTHRELKKAQESIREKILTLSGSRREDLQNFLASSIAEKQAAIDTILHNISTFTPQILRFGPTAKNLSKGTLQTCSELLMDFKWIDFLQNTNDKNPSAVILPEKKALRMAYRLPIEKGIFWGYLQDTKKACIAIEIPFEFITPPSSTSAEETVVQHSKAFVPTAYFLFDLEKIRRAGKIPLPQEKDFSFSSAPIAWAEGYVLKVDEFIQLFERAISLVIDHHIIPPEEFLKSQEFKKKSNAEEVLHFTPNDPLFSSQGTEKFMQDLQEATLQRFFQMNMIWILASIHSTGVFGNDLFSYPSPDAISMFSLEDGMGIGFDTQDVFLATPLFDDQSYFSSHTSSQPTSELGNSLALITDKQREHLYLGNTAQFEINSNGTLRFGYLTLGMDTDHILQKLVLALHQSAMIVHQGKVISAFNSDGTKMSIENTPSLPVLGMLGQSYGLTPWGKKTFFFLHMKPFPEVDLHFFLFNPEEEEFALLHDLESGSEQVVKKIVWNIHAIGLIALFIAILLLHNISRRVTKPIIQLAHATQDVVEGRLDNISLPTLEHQDEIATLCLSFEKMVQGLAEKEKVKGVLNKVVSQEIAQEILKGNVHLGGEEKKVTVLFADIRDFTTMTQHMPPQQVIELLNTCMTKISTPIDRHGGVIDKYVGDEAMALFGAPISAEDGAIRAIQAALEIRTVLKHWNEERTKQGALPIEMGISIHTGIMLAGNMGAENRLNYTVLGSNVNLAARLCHAAKRMEILISKETFREPRVQQEVICNPVPPLEVKGFDHLIEAFLVQGLRHDGHIS